MFRVLFVCTANVCRSPLAEAIFNRKVLEAGVEDRIWSTSTGTWAAEGVPASSMTKLVAMENGLNLETHRSTAITLEMIKTNDLILCMTPVHKKDLLEIFPHLKHKIYTLREFGRKKPPAKEAIDDPIGMNLNFYRRIFREISDEIDRIWDIVLEMSRQKEIREREARAAVRQSSTD